METAPIQPDPAPEPAPDPAPEPTTAPTKAEPATKPEPTTAPTKAEPATKPEATTAPTSKTAPTTKTAPATKTAPTTAPTTKPEAAPSQPEAADEFDYEFAVIGGGSGGMASAKEAAKLGAKTVLFDYVEPTEHGTKWGIGGTCVNVGCVPKKLMHYASLMGPILRNDAPLFGWRVSQEASNDVQWQQLVGNVQATVKRLNFGYRTGLRSAKVTYINSYASFVDSHNLQYTGPKGEKLTVSARYILIAVGGRPRFPPELPNSRRLSITSDDLFSLKKAPGKTLIVGASFIALECAGFLNEMSFDVTVVVRSVPLRQFDRQCADKVAQLMAEMGVKFFHRVTVASLDDAPDGKILATFNGGPEPDIFDSVLFAAGRQASTGTLNLDAVGVESMPNGKIVAIEEQSTVENVFAVGDCLEGVPELTPTAIRAGELLARRLFGGSTEQMNYGMAPCAVFSPVEYAFVGMSEEEAVHTYGEEDLEIYLQEYTTLEQSAAHREKVEAMREHEYDITLSPNCLSKLICVKSLDERVVGFHFVGPNAGEVTQGFAVALRLNATKEDFDSTVGIHPTDAESFTALKITKASGKPFRTAGCGGGKCA